MDVESVSHKITIDQARSVTSSATEKKGLSVFLNLLKSRDEDVLKLFFFFTILMTAHASR